ncbi:MAG: Ig-like domain-containing protein [Oscillospiraceae bacterium]|nr:Ig-like domain-containing protein [Oscillospiraceae bacterium]
MKRAATAWALLSLFVLGSTPAWADISAIETAAIEAAVAAEEAAEAAETGTITEETATETEALSDYEAGLAAEALTGTTAAESQEDGGENTAPVAENQELETYRGVSVGGQLTAYDAEGDSLTFEITTEPIKGTVELTAEGYFVYTPREGKRGKDYFGFRVTDSAGNVSQEGTVIIKLLRQKSKVTYSDMTGSALEYAAIVLTEAGVFTGEYVGEDYVFNPEAAVTRGEFLTMCMTAAGCDLLQGVSSTGFGDDADIDAWLKPYVATALLKGYVQGVETSTGANFCPDEDITLRDACLMLNSVLGVTDVVSAAAYVGQDNANTTWAQAVANLTACSVMLSDWEDIDQVLTRAGAAELLANAIGLLSSR